MIGNDAVNYSIIDFLLPLKEFQNWTLCFSACEAHNMIRPFKLSSGTFTGQICRVKMDFRVSGFTIREKFNTFTAQS